MGDMVGGKVWTAVGDVVGDVVGDAVGKPVSLTDGRIGLRTARSMQTSSYMTRQDSSEEVLQLANTAKMILLRHETSLPTLNLNVSHPTNTGTGAASFDKFYRRRDRKCTKARPQHCC